MKKVFIHPDLPQEPSFLKDEFNRNLINEVHPDDWANPTPAACYNLVVIGGGTAGLVTAIGAAGLGAKVALVERGFLGGDCLNVGCVPSKALTRAGRICADIRNAASYGVAGNLELENFTADFAKVMERIRKIRARIGRHDSAERLRDHGVDVFFGEATFRDKKSIKVNDLTLRFKKAVIATGSRPATPNIPGLKEAGFLTNETVFNLTQLPKRLIVIGGGPLGCEMAQAFQRLGSKVIIVEKKTLFLPNEERDAAQLLSDSFAKDGMQIRLNTEVTNVTVNGHEKWLELRSESHTEVVAVDEILTGVGRSPNVEGLDLEKANIRFNFEKGIEVNDFLQTTNPFVYAAGDVASKYMYTHTASATARIVIQNALFWGRKRFSNLVIPWCTYTDPEVAHVGVYVRDARAQGLPIKSYTIPMHQVDRAIIDGEETGFVKVHVREGTDHILGATIVARHAGEMINEVSLAMVMNLGLGDLVKVIHSYPTQAEAIRQTADAYLKTKLTPRLEKMARLWMKLNR